MGRQSKKQLLRVVFPRQLNFLQLNLQHKSCFREHSIGRDRIRADKESVVKEDSAKEDAVEKSSEDLCNLMEPKKIRRCLNKIKEVLTGPDSELGHGLGRLSIFGNVWEQEFLRNGQDLFLKDSDLLQLLRRGLANHRFRYTVVPEAVSVRVVIPSRFVDEQDNSEEFWHERWENEECSIREFLDRIMDFRRNIVEEGFCQLCLRV